MSKNYILKKVSRLRIEDRATGETKVRLTDLKNIGLSTGQEQVEATGADNTKLAIFEIGKTATLTATNGMISMGYMAMQVGSDPEILNGTTEVKITRTITTENGTTASLPHKAWGTVGNEIGFIYKSEFGGQGEKYEQRATATAEFFAYNPSTNQITLPTGKFQAGDKIIVDFRPKLNKVEKVTNSANNYSMVGRIFVDAWFTDPCNGDKDIPLLMVMERGKISGAVDLQFGDQAAVQNVSIEGLTNVCDDEKELFKLYTYDMNEVVI